MKNLGLLPALLVMLVLVSLTTCKKDNSDTPEKLYVGSWDKTITADVTFDARLNLNEDGTFSWIVMDPVESHTNSQGAYEIVDGQ